MILWFMKNPLRMKHWPAVSQPTKRPRILRWAVVAVLCAPALLFGASLHGCFPWSPINCSHHDVDIHSGRVRFNRYLFWLRVHDSVEDSALTRALRPDDFASTTPKWHHAVTLSPGLGHSLHYKFHSAIAQIRELELVWSLAEFTPAARRASAHRRGGTVDGDSSRRMRDGGWHWRAGGTGGRFGPPVRRAKQRRLRRGGTVDGGSGRWMRGGGCHWRSLWAASAEGQAASWSVWTKAGGWK